MSTSRPEAVLFDRDDTLIENVPYNGDPALVLPVAGAREALDAVRAAGLRTGVVTNQSAIGRGYITEADMQAVNARVEELLGPFDTWQFCPHTPQDDCACRKPLPGMVLAAAAALGVDPGACVLIGDTAGDMAAAHAAGARGILVPGPATTEQARREAPAISPDLGAAVRMALHVAATHGAATEAP
ncbi:HAD-IIIA family hydrolase [Allobranchiibius sp. CTAmp26]|uniref:D-glycero-alpha-D-manno-heptose-1,7-bisphosphate 7-phosphatase n=1 Tax=Allobranchiibius sp. CTAmp26 TaxID=2815214 RepID=UPI0027DC15A1|nr:HAD-IIIA family hydrolase [Allobranchiibius sp. CTAmp26]